MATITYPLAEFDNGNVRFEMDYDDTLSPLRIGLLRCINNSSSDLLATATLISDPSRTVSRTYGPGTTTQNVPQGAQNRLGITIEQVGSKLRITNIRWQFAWPA